MNKKINVLMELHPSMYGFSGIPQETRLLFAHLLNIPEIQVSGLINTDLPHLRSDKSKIATNHQRIDKVARQIISLMDPYSLSLQQKCIFYLQFWQVLLKSKFGHALPMHRFQSLGFANFIWEVFFAKTLPTSEFTNITSAEYYLLYYSPYSLRRFLKHRVNKLKIATQDFNIFVAQNPFSGQVAANTQLVIRYHDTIPLFYPHMICDPAFHQGYHYQALCANAKTAWFVCTSKDVQQDLINIFPELEKRTTVIYNTIAPQYCTTQFTSQQVIEIIQNYSFDPELKLAKEDLVTQPLHFLLMVSTLEPRKNHMRLIRAWEAVRTQLQLPLKLIFVGELGWQYAPILAAMRPWQHRGQLFHLQKVPIEYLRVLYQAADCVICPSFKEGFDLSGVEAMACGGKVVASNIPVHKEVYGDAARYFDAYSFEDQAQIIQQVVTPKNTTAPLLHTAGLKQAQLYQQNSIRSQWQNFFTELTLPQAF